MTTSSERSACVFCGEPSTDTIEPPRRTLARGPDPDDAAFSVIAVLPDLRLCALHAGDLRRGGLAVGWCDDERCRGFGRTGEVSPCGAPYKELRR